MDTEIKIFEMVFNTPKNRFKKNIYEQMSGYYFALPDGPSFGHVRLICNLIDITCDDFFQYRAVDRYGILDKLYPTATSTINLL
jgi:hypothetical protein